MLHCALLLTLPNKQLRRGPTTHAHWVIIILNIIPFLCRSNCHETSLSVKYLHVVPCSEAMDETRKLGANSSEMYTGGC